MEEYGHIFREFMPHFKTYMIENNYITESWYSFLHSYANNYKYYDEEMVKELKTISLLSGISFVDIFTYNFMYEITAYHKPNKNGKNDDSGMCSAILIRTSYN